jgi:hypothetical protein
MKYNYDEINKLVKNINDFQKLSNTTDNTLKLKYIKFIRIKQKIKELYDKKLEYVKEQRYTDACNIRDKERKLIIKLLKPFNIKES